MSDPTITNIDNNQVVIEGSFYDDDTLTFAGAGTVVAGTILARNATTKKLVPYVKGGSAAVNGVASAVLTIDSVATAAGDKPVRPLLEGRVNFAKLIIDADGDNSNIDANVIDELRKFDLITVKVTDQSILDNQ